MHRTRLLLLLLIMVLATEANAKYYTLAELMQTELEFGLQIEGSERDSADGISGKDVYYGKCMKLKWYNMEQQTIYIKVPAGTYLVSEDTAVQNMFVTKSFEIEMKTNQLDSVYFFAMCAEIHDRAPDIADYYNEGPAPNPVMIDFVKFIESEDNQTNSGQLALWAVTDSADYGNLGAYSDGDRKVELKAAYDFLKKAKADVPFLKEYDNREKFISDAQNNAAIKVYIIGGVLAAVLIFLYVRSNRRFRKKMNDKNKKA